MKFRENDDSHTILIFLFRCILYHFKLDESFWKKPLKLDDALLTWDQRRDRGVVAASYIIYWLHNHTEKGKPLSQRRIFTTFSAISVLKVIKLLA